jgi:hypothetical protein
VESSGSRRNRVTKSSGRLVSERQCPSEASSADIRDDRDLRRESMTRGLEATLHGEPFWSDLYRRMIPILAAAGHHVICPDLVV